MATSNGVGAGHLIRTSAIARELKSFARPIIFSMANSAIQVSQSMELEHEYVPGRDKGWMPRWRWDRYLRDRLVALIDELDAKLITFDGVVPYPGIFAAKLKRPEVSLVWIRRGMWRSQPQGMALNFQSKLMDYIIEPGDIARKYDNGPTRHRDDAVVTSPVTYFSRSNLLSRVEAKKLLGLDLKKKSVLVQLGVGESDIDQRVSYILNLLSNYSNLQVVMVRDPVDQNGVSLKPAGLDLKKINHFPLVNAFAAFEAIICASGYNSVHEIIPAKVPTLLIPNDRGTDNQQARAKWCADSGLALMSNGKDLKELEKKIAELMSSRTQRDLMEKCSAIPQMSGGEEIAKMLRVLLDKNVASLVIKRLRHQRILAQSRIEKGLTDILRKSMNFFLRGAAFVFRIVFPHNPSKTAVVPSQIVFAINGNYLPKELNPEFRLEHLFAGSSEGYMELRVKIAERAYQVSKSKFQMELSSGNVESIPRNSSIKSA
jgi:UDP-N-acetylglucosamine:LPS N-acetylglucosamine transferase